MARIALPVALRQGAPAAVLAALPGSRAVGGAVRDALAGLALHDVDVAAPLPPEEISARLRAAGLKVFETGLAHGTVTAVLDHEPVEVTSLRRDVVTDGRHAEVAWTEDWREDAARRDFTINAMSLSAGGALWDYFGGRADLAAGRVRFVGEPCIRLQEDYLRALRFFRFQARYGRGAPDQEAVAAIRAAVPGLARLSVERVWMELKRLLAAPDPREAVALMAETGVLGAVLPEAQPPQLQDLGCLVRAAAPHEPVLWLTVLLPPATADLAGDIARRLRLSGEERDDLVHLHTELASRPFIPDRTEPMRRQWYATRTSQRMALLEAWLAEARDQQDRSALRRWIEQTPFPRLPVMGRDALAIGIGPGPQVGRLLKALEAWWQAGGGTAPREACLAKLRELAAAEPSG
ncbi:CCA tRNA nucleotidyltransferase [Paeniroseomonas aquatica]|uniref:CCA tRNA nucleotidyltransferase n=1 Tax=Paeniroseomonas aquatica TaxID=373043 RepID=UPI00338EB1D7